MKVKKSIIEDFPSVMIARNVTFQALKRPTATLMPLNETTLPLPIGF